MRAMLSTGAGHAEDGSRYVCGLNVESALAEARAIMAETEPMGDDYYAGRTTMHSAVYMNARTLGHGTALAEAQGALAESLRAFLA